MAQEGKINGRKITWVANKARRELILQKKRQISISKEIYTFQEIWIVGKLSKVKQTFSHFAYPRSPINSSNTCLALSLLAGVLNCLSFIFQPIATQSGVSEGNVGK